MTNVDLIMEKSVFFLLLLLFVGSIPLRLLVFEKINHLSQDFKIRLRLLNPDMNGVMGKTTLTEYFREYFNGEAKTVSTCHIYLVIRVYIINHN